MRCILVVFMLVVLCLVALPQGINESFNYDNLDGTSWKGDTPSFMISENNMLQLNAETLAGEKYVYSPCDVADSATWSFRVINEFNPSSANYTRVWLIADNNCPENVKNGIFIEIGGTKDNISLVALEAGVKKNFA